MTDEDERKKLERARADYRLAMGEEPAPPVRLPVTAKVAGIRSMTFEELMKVDHFEFTDDEAAKFLANLRADPDYQAADPSTAKPAELAEWVAPEVREEHRAIAGRTLARLRRAGIDIPPDLPLSDEKKREIAMNIFPGADRQPRLEPVFYPPLEEGPFVIEEALMPRYVYETVPDERLNQLAHTADSDPAVDATIDSDTGLPVTSEKLEELALDQIRVVDTGDGFVRMIDPEHPELALEGMKAAPRGLTPQERNMLGRRLAAEPSFAVVMNPDLPKLKARELAGFPPCRTCGETPTANEPALSNGVCFWCGYWGIPVGAEREELRAKRKASPPSADTEALRRWWQEKGPGASSGPPCVDCGLPESVHADAGGSRGLDGCKGYR